DLTNLTDISAGDEAEHVLGIHLVGLARFAEGRTRCANKGEQNQSDRCNGDQWKPLPASAKTGRQTICVNHQELVPCRSKQCTQPCRPVRDSFKSEARVLVGDREDRAGGRQVRLLRWERCTLSRSEPAWLRERAEEARPAYATHSTDRADQASRDGDRHHGLR